MAKKHAARRTTVTTGKAMGSLEARIPVFDSAMSATKVRTEAAATVPHMCLTRNDRLVTCRGSSTADAMATGRTVMARARAAKANQRLRRSGLRKAERARQMVTAQSRTAGIASIQRADRAGDDHGPPVGLWTRTASCSR